MSASKNRAKSLVPLFRPRSVAVVGASRRPGAIGGQVVANLLAAGFTGPVYPVNAKSKVVHSIPTYGSVEKIPGPVDLAVIVVPADQVLKVAESCGRKGVKALVVITAGFREVGGEGIKREEKLLAIAGKHGMRVVGPNCMGIINTGEGYSLNASFAGTLPEPGPVAMVSQSGALGEAILADATAAGIGVSMFASVGNRADVTAADLIEFWEHEEEVRAILLYIESFGNPELFVQAARRVSRHKPIIAVKSGRSAAGALAAGSHTGSVAGADLAANSMLAQCGVLRVVSFREMFSLAATLLHQPAPKQDRIAVVTNAGGPGILATDALVNCGLQMAEFGEDTRAALRAALPEEASLQNPVDLIASADAPRYRAALRAVSRDRAVDGVLVLFVSPIMIDAAAVAEAIIAETCRRDGGLRKPVLACVMGRRRSREATDLLKAAGIPVFRYPEDAAQTMRSLVRRGVMLAREPAGLTLYPVQRRKVSTILKAAEGWLAAEDAEAVLAAYGIPFAASERVDDVVQACRAAEKIGYPVVLKAEAEGLLHKSEHRAVAAGLQDRGQVEAAAMDFSRRLGKKFKDLKLQVQAQATGHREILVGMTRDPRFGPLFALGLGGTEVEVLRDVSVRVAPLDDQDPVEMLSSLKGAALLDAFRGKAAVDKALACELLLRVQQLVFDHPRIAEVEINPFILAAKGQPSLAVDARLRLSEPA
ncbi:MAG: acetate--CoA ligase family protein [Planctomycetota bacterium]